MGGGSTPKKFCSHLVSLHMSDMGINNDSNERLRDDILEVFGVQDDFVTDFYGAYKAVEDKLQKDKGARTKKHSTNFLKPISFAIDNHYMKKALAEITADMKKTGKIELSEDNLKLLEMIKVKTDFIR
mmetsp:Transcript_36098/g.55444  ORF Transcript_36098/g.55444 Transcript_36098/m.55444 type:complete len:128 (+) Transcript_36098:151-534(+)